MTHHHQSLIIKYFIGTGKKAKLEKSSVKQSKKVNFEDTEKDGSQIIEGGRVTPSLVKVGTVGSEWCVLQCNYVEYHYSLA